MKPVSGIVIALVIAYICLIGYVTAHGTHSTTTAGAAAPQEQKKGGEHQMNTAGHTAGNAEIYKPNQELQGDAGHGHGHHGHGHHGHGHHHPHEDITVYVNNVFENGSQVIINNDNCTIPSGLCIKNCSREELLKSKVKFLYDNLIYPLNVAILLNQSTALDNIFDPDVQGRFDPLGTFEGKQELKEYYFALGATPAGHAIAVDYVSLFASGNEVFVRVNVLFEYYDLQNGSVTSRQNITELGRYLFSNKTDLIVSTDLIIHNVGPFQDPPAVARPLVIQGLCANLLVSPGLCNKTTDPDGYYQDMTDCITYMSTIEYGTWADVSSNTTTCRLFHSILASFDPMMHCPHTGKTGGGKCVYFPYASYYDKFY